MDSADRNADRSESDEVDSAVVHVAVGAIVDGGGRVLIARRPEHLHQGGLWEFPGGKLHPNEDVDAALLRELREELGIECEPGRPLIEIPWNYAGRRVRLHVRMVRHWIGTPEGREGQPLRWCEAAELDEVPMPAANRPIVRALALPGVYCISDDAPDDEESWLAVLEHNCQSGAQLIQMRRHDLDDERYAGLACEAAAVAHRYGAQLMLNRPLDAGLALLERTAADGLHLPAAVMRTLTALPDAARGAGLFAGSCHGPEEVQKAAALDLDFAVLSPVQPTSSHPTAVPIGWTRFQQWVSDAPLPIYALGGLSPGHEERATQSGGQGVAGIQGFWNRF